MIMYAVETITYILIYADTVAIVYNVVVYGIKIIS